MHKLPPLVALFLLALSSQLSAAKPSTAEPQGMFSTRPQALSQRAALNALQLFSQCDEELTKYEENLAEGRYRQASTTEMKRISKTYVKVREHERAAIELRALLEPSGIDMTYRNAVLYLRIQEVIRGYKELPGAIELIGKANPATQTFAKGQAKQLDGLEEPLNQGKADLVARRLYDVWDDVEEPIVWQDRQVAEKLRAPFVIFERRLLPQLEQARLAQAVELITQLRKAQTPPYDRFLENVDVAVKSVGENGSATWGGSMHEGPDLLAQWMVGWQQAHAMSLRAQALGWSLPPEAEAAAADTLAKDYQAFHQKMVASCAALIEADAKRVDATEVASLYGRYLEALAMIIPQMANDSLREAVTPALASLRDKSPEFAQTVGAYRRATSEALRWRERKADASRRHHQGDAPALAALLQQAAQPEAKVARTGQRETEIHELLWPAPALVQDVSSIVVDKQTVASNFASHATSPVMSNPFESHYFARGTKPEVPAAEVEALKTDLLVAPGAPPLTLDAVLAIATAEQGYFTAIGGTVQGVELDSLIGRMLETDNYTIFPVGDIQSEKPKDPLSQLGWGVQLTPEWAQHRYFFLALP